MITIIYDEKGKDMSLQASGHAGYAPKGQDIVCAAVSTLMQSLAYSVDSGTVTCDPGGDNILRVQANRSLDTLAKFELVIDGLYLLAQQYPENVQLMNLHANDADNMDLQLFGDGAAAGSSGDGAQASEGESSPVAPPALRPAQERLAKRSRPGKAAKVTTEKNLQPPAGGSSLNEGAKVDAERLAQEEAEPDKGNEQEQGSETEENVQLTPEQRRNAFAKAMQQYPEEFEEAMQHGDLENLAHGGQFSFNSVPQSATGQYDRLYNAYAGGDSDEAKAAVEKLNAMVEAGTIAENKMYSQLKSRLVKYDVRVRQAAEEQNAGNDQKRYELENEMIEQLSEVLGLPKGKRGDVVDCVTGAVNQLAEKQLKGDNASVTDDLVEAVDSWDAGAVQEEYDRLAKAGKSATTLKSKITETAKPEYLAGSDADRQQMEKMLLALKDADGEELYTEKNFAQWVEEAEKKAEEGPKPDPYAAVR